MRYSMGFAGALLLAMSSSLLAVDAVRDAGSKIRENWENAPARAYSNNAGTVNRSYSVAPSAPAPVAAAPAPVAATAPAAVAAAPAAPSTSAVRSYSYQPAQTYNYNNNRRPARSAPYLRADHKILNQYGD
jgi:hypothetical protein